MASLLASIAARKATAFRRIPSGISPSQAASLLQRRGLADQHGPPKVNIWEDPLSPGKWKEEHHVPITLFGMGLVIYYTYKIVTYKGEIPVRETPYHRYRKHS